jgi:F420-non-reducing hydrogenase large subunit
MSVRDAARKYVDGGDVKPGMLNSVERAFRAYDPCLACATHSLTGETPLRINIYDAQHTKIRELSQNLGGTP